MGPPDHECPDAPELVLGLCAGLDLLGDIASSARAATPPPEGPPTRDGCLVLYAKFLQSPSEVSTDELNEALLGLSSCVPQDHSALKVLFSLPYAKLLRCAVDLETRTINALFPEFGVSGVPFLKPDFSEYLNDFTKDAMKEIYAKLDAASCLPGFESLCQRRRAAFAIQFPFLGPLETTLFVVAVTVGPLTCLPLALSVRVPVY